MQITNNTLYNKDLILKYNKFYLRSYMLKNFIIITVVSLAFAIYMLVQEQYTYAGLLIAILLVYYLLTLGMQKLTTKRMLKRSPLVENPILQTYVFTDQNFTVTNIKTHTVDYINVQKVRHGPDFYLIQTNDRKTYIIDYKGFEKEEERIKLEELFKERFGLKIK
jgi:hypothetical protein